MTLSSPEFIRQGPRGVPRDEIRHSELGALRVPVFEDVVAAGKTLFAHLEPTPVIRSKRLDDLAGGTVWLKAENLQITNSFKVRGALNALLAMDPDQRARGVIAYSTGNHGQAIAWAAKKMGVTATIVMPHDAPANKIARAINHGAHLEYYNRTRERREVIGMRLLQERGGSLVPPGDHPDVLAAQGTVALEAWHQLSASKEEIAFFVAPCGGGGLMAGCSLALSHLSPATTLCAVEPAAYDDTVRSLLVNKRESNEPGAVTDCDALQASTPAELPFEINRNLIDRACSVNETDVRKAVRFAAEELRLIVEPGGAVALAAVLSGRISLAGRSALIVLSGGNIDSSVLAQFLTNTERDELP